MEEKRMRRSKTDKLIAGVCGGLGEYFNIDPTLIRLVFGVLLFAQGVGAIIYLVLWIVLPYRELTGGNTSRTNATEGMEDITIRVQSFIDENLRTTRTSGDQIAVLIGGTLVVLGTVFLLEAISPVLFSTLRNFFWPAILILGGLVMILHYQRSE